MNVLIVDPGGGKLLVPLVSELRRQGHSLEFEEDTQGLLERLTPPRFQVVVAPYDLDDPPVSNLVERLRRSGRLVPFVAAVDEGGAKAEPGLLAGGVDLVVDVREPAASAARLMALVWGEGASPSDNALESVVKRLRPKLGAQASRLSSVRLRGYVLEAPAA